MVGDSDDSTQCVIFQNGSMERIIEYPVIDSIHKRGIYSFKFVYNETRDHLVCESVRSMLSASRLKVRCTCKIRGAVMVCQTCVGGESKYCDADGLYIEWYR